MAIKIQQVPVQVTAQKIVRVARKIAPLLSAMRWERPEPAFSWFLNSHCSCGCRLSTDDKYVWCSSVFHEWHESKSDFMKSMRIEKQYGVEYLRRFR
jgi:hypothetical protein